MAVTDYVPGTTGNLFLDSLNSDMAASIFPHAELVQAITTTVVTAAREPVRYIAFPLTCAISVVTRMNDGTDVEAMLIGREGFYGLHAVLGNDISANEAVVQLPGMYLRVPTAHFVKLFRDNPVLQRHVLAFANATIEMISQFTGCNRLHSINERGARWILMAHDRVVGDIVYITHEYLATMLGVRRPGVSLATAAFDQMGYIESQRGRVIIKDRMGLEKTSCECYAIANNSLERLVGINVRKH